MSVSGIKYIVTGSGVPTSTGYFHPTYGRYSTPASEPATEPCDDLCPSAADLLRELNGAKLVIRMQEQENEALRLKASRLDAMLQEATAALNAHREGVRPAKYDAWKRVGQGDFSWVKVQVRDPGARPIQPVTYSSLTFDQQSGVATGIISRDDID